MSKQFYTHPLWELSFYDAALKFPDYGILWINVGPYGVTVVAGINPATTARL